MCLSTYSNNNVTNNIGIRQKNTKKIMTEMTKKTVSGVISQYTKLHIIINITQCQRQQTTKKTNPFNGPCPELPGWAGTRKVQPIWILLKQETVSGSGISWAICKSAPCSRQMTTPTPHHSVFYRPDTFPAAHVKKPARFIQPFG